MNRDKLKRVIIGFELDVMFIKVYNVVSLGFSASFLTMSVVSDI